MDAPSTDESIFQIKPTLAKPQSKLDPDHGNPEDAVQVPQKSLPSHPNSFNLFRGYLKFAYYTGQQPWKPVYNRAKDCWEVTSSKIQKGLCCALLVVMLTGAAITVHRPPEHLRIQLTKDSPLHYLKQVSIGLTAVQFLWFPWTMFKSSADLPIILNHENRNRALFHSGRVRKYVCIMYLILVHLVFIQRAFIQMILIHPTNPTFVLSNRGFQFFLYGSGTNGTTTSPVDTETTDLWNAQNIAWSLIKFIGLFSHRFQFAMQVLFYVCTLPLTLWGATAELETKLQSIEEGRSRPGECMSLNEVVVQEYARLKDLSDAVNRSWSTQLASWIIAVTLLVIVGLKGAGERWVTIVPFVIEWFSLLVLLILFAQVSRIMERFRSWLLRVENAQIFSEAEDRLWWEVTLMEVEGGRVGMGAVGMYNIDYGFLAQYAAVCITFVVVSFDK